MSIRETYRVKTLPCRRSSATPRRPSVYRRLNLNAVYLHINSRRRRRVNERDDACVTYVFFLHFSVSVRYSRFVPESNNSPLRVTKGLIVAYNKYRTRRGNSGKSSLVVENRFFFQTFFIICIKSVLSW